MLNGMTIPLISIIILALLFDFINGFHDTANAVATTISTRVLSPMAAIVWASIFNFIGAFSSQHVAGTVAKDIVNNNMINEFVIIAALISAIIWNLVTWFFGIPSSSSHALFGGIIGSSVIYAQNINVLKADGIINKVIIPLFTSPLIGFVLGYIFMSFLNKLLRSSTPYIVNKYFSKFQILSGWLMAFSHGNNDAQKSMGIITLALIYADKNGGKNGVQLWVIIACACAMALGTSIGGWRIIKTMGVGMMKLQPIHGFAVQTAATAVIETMTRLGAPVSTTHIITSSVMGVGASKRFSAVRWGLAKNIIWTWVLTIPTTIAIGALVSFILNFKF